MRECKKITGGAFVHLGRLQTLSITRCVQITDGAFVHLPQLATLIMT